uniref:Uncharacterized protein n=1 Tax=Rhizophora mucronata TaxID=61149 RepID=A0A2P2NM45_RHIMU
MGAPFLSKFSSLVLSCCMFVVNPFLYYIFNVICFLQLSTSLYLISMC